MSTLRGNSFFFSPTNGSVDSGSANSSPMHSRDGGASGNKRNQDTARLVYSPVSVDDEEEREGRRIGVKRACNECRQQKVSYSHTQTMPSGFKEQPCLVRDNADRYLCCSYGVMLCKTLFALVIDVED